jgi:hypothetical protein
MTVRSSSPPNTCRANGAIDGATGNSYFHWMTSTDTADARPRPLREARLRPEAANRVQWAPTGVWLPASTLADQALQHAAEIDPRARALGDDAFEFRGGRPEAARRTQVRTRRSDHPGPGFGRRRNAFLEPGR